MKVTNTDTGVTIELNHEEKGKLRSLCNVANPPNLPGLLVLVSDKSPREHLFRFAYELCGHLMD